MLDDPSAEPRLSLLAIRDATAVGHILFTRAYLAGQEDAANAAILAPLAVHPKAHSQGVGGKLIEEGLIDGAPMFQLCLGIPHASPATPEILNVMKGLLPGNANWSAFGISRMEFSIVAQAASQGGNCRVGLEDNLYLEKGEFATNLKLVERAVRIIREVGREPATPAQAAERLGIKR
jgi:uncharacterized protein (DUF849 family)